MKDMDSGEFLDIGLDDEGKILITGNLSPAEAFEKGAVSFNMVPFGNVSPDKVLCYATYSKTN